MAKSSIKYTAPVIIEGGFTIENIKENGVLYKNIKVLENLSDSMNYEEIQEFDARAREAGTAQAISLPLIMSTARQGLREGNNDYLNYLQESFKKCPNFFSIIDYNPEGQKDKIIHYEGTPDEYSFKGNFVGPDKLIEEVEDTRTTYALTGIKGTSLLHKISQSVNQTPGFLWRVNEKPLETDRWTMRLYANGGRLYFGAYRNPLSRLPVFRVELGERIKL